MQQKWMYVSFEESKGVCMEYLVGVVGIGSPLSFADKSFFFQWKLKLTTKEYNMFFKTNKQNHERAVYSYSKDHKSVLGKYCT